MAHFSTHVLDTVRGEPASGVVVDIHRLRQAGRQHLQTLTTGADGRAGGQQLEPGAYELTFHAGDYFRAAGVKLPDPPFLDEVVIRFGIADPAGRYHVPLLLAPYSYSTYRGS
ncbi:MAG: hydroxyisourate hydrolase [Acidobacteriia bacterium]|nr:hydroxyisourate hydrolase [Terriglobia bacterium]